MDNLYRLAIRMSRHFEDHITFAQAAIIPLGFVLVFVFLLVITGDHFLYWIGLSLSVGLFSFFAGFSYVHHSLYKELIAEAHKLTGYKS